MSQLRFRFEVEPSDILNREGHTRQAVEVTCNVRTGE